MSGSGPLQGGGADAKPKKALSGFPPVPASPGGRTSSRIFTPASRAFGLGALSDHPPTLRGCTEEHIWLMSLIMMR